MTPDELYLTDHVRDRWCERADPSCTPARAHDAIKAFLADARISRKHPWSGEPDSDPDVRYATHPALPDAALVICDGTRVVTVLNRADWRVRMPAKPRGEVGRGCTGQRQLGRTARAARQQIASKDPW